jgi:hypothetical protein
MDGTNSGTTASVLPSTVTIVPTNIDWNKNTATLEVQLMVNGEKVIPTNYY